MCSGGRTSPTSSSNSRRAAASGVSPGSRRPPGRAHWPTWRRRPEARRVRSTAAPPPSPGITTTATAACRRSPMAALRRSKRARWSCRANRRASSKCENMLLQSIDRRSLAIESAQDGPLLRNDLTMTKSFSFPDGFLWGAATSAYQIEGSPLADGAGPSIWHRFVRTPWLVPSGDTGDVACDHYRRYQDDVRLMRDRGLNAYRFSVSWSRVLPEGRGRINEQGLDFYRRLVDALLENGIRPALTLYHWDLPAALDDLGGWLNRDVASWFAEYAQVMYRALDGKVEMWTTLNEPWVVTDGGYLHGALAPGHRNLFEAPIASHHLLLAHAAAVEAYRAEGKHQIGLVVNIEPKYPASESNEDLAATRRADAYMNRQYLDPVIHGRYPDEMREIFGEAWPDFSAEDLEKIRQPIDFLGINYYTRSVTCNGPAALPVRAGRVRQTRHVYTE